MSIADIGRVTRPHARASRSRRLLRTFAPAIFLVVGLATLGFSIWVSLAIGAEVLLITATLMVLHTFAGRQRDYDRHP